jgi:hypothetical protein
MATLKLVEAGHERRKDVMPAQSGSNVVKASLRWLGLLALAAIALLAGRAVGPAVPLAPLPSYVLSFSALCGFVLASSELCPARVPRALVFVIIPLGCIGGLWWLGGSGPFHAALVLLALLAFGGLVGCVVGAAIEHPGHLLFVVLVSSAADALSVLHPSGPSAAIVASEQALSLLALPFPLLGTDATPPLLGVGDVVFAGLYTAAARAHGLAAPRTRIALAAGFLVTMLVVVLAELAVPALPFLGAAMLIAHPQARRPPARERRSGMIALIVLVLLAAALWRAS